jgi:predicted amidohydrolase YtcJ
MATADLIVRNARIATLDHHRPEASAQAITNGRFSAIGDDRAVAAHRTSRTTIIDAQARRVIPALVDSHIHVIRGGLNYHLELRWTTFGQLLMRCRCCNGKQRERRRPNGFASSGAGVNSVR